MTREGIISPRTALSSSIDIGDIQSKYSQEVAHKLFEDPNIRLSIFSRKSISKKFNNLRKQEIKILTDNEMLLRK